MNHSNSSIRFKQKTFIHFIVVIIILVIATPVLADYLGPDRTVTEATAIKAIFSDQTEEIIKRKLKSDYLPVRMRELQELKKAGFNLVYDEMNNSYSIMKL